MAGKGLGAEARPLLQWFSSGFTHKWGSLKSAYATVVGKVTCMVATSQKVLIARVSQGFLCCWKRQEPCHECCGVLHSRLSCYTRSASSVLVVVTMI